MGKVKEYFKHYINIPEEDLRVFRKYGLTQEQILWKKGEEFIRSILLFYKYFDIQQLDWVCLYNEKLYIVEVKTKKDAYKYKGERFFWLDSKQIERKKRLSKKAPWIVGTLLLLIDIEGDKVLKLILEKLDYKKYYKPKGKDFYLINEKEFIEWKI